MQGYYDTEFQPELKRADVERELAKAARLDQAATIRHSPWRERLASTLIALAARLAPSAGEALVANRPATGTTLS